MIVKILLISFIIIMSIVLIFLIVVGIKAYLAFIQTFKRAKCYSLLDLDLSKTHYAKHIDVIKKNIEELQNNPCDIVSIVNDKLHLYARYYDLKSKNTVIMAHGYHATSFNNFHSSSRSFFNHGYNILMIDERSHNDSEGKYTTVGLREQYDLLAWIKWVEDNTESDNIILYGVSMGAATVGYVSNKLKGTKVRAVVMDCGFTSFYDEVFYKRRDSRFIMLGLFFFRLYGKLILHIDIKKSTIDSLKDSLVPVYFIHGLNDEMVPYEHTITNYNAATTDKKVHYVENCGHTTGFLIDYDFLDKDLFEFIDKYLV